MADHWERRVAELDGRLIDAEEVRAKWTEIGAKIRTRFQSFASEITPRLYGKEPAAIEAELQAGVDAVLAELADD